MEIFIEHVRTYPCLWNPQHPEYREMSIRDQAWNQVVKKCNNNIIKDTRAARSEWKKLRDNHREALKRAKLGQNKLLPAQITTWKYAKAMQFLEPFMKYRITEDIDMEPVASFRQDQDVSTTDEDGIKTESQSKRRCTECNSPSESTRHLDHDTDALESFFECVLKSTREMPPWMRTQVKKKIFAVVIDAEEQLSILNLPKTNEILIETKVKTEVFED